MIALYILGGLLATAVATVGAIVVYTAVRYAFRILIDDATRLSTARPYL